MELQLCYVMTYVLAVFTFAFICWIKIHKIQIKFPVNLRGNTENSCKFTHLPEKVFRRLGNRGGGDYLRLILQVHRQKIMQKIIFLIEDEVKLDEKKVVYIKLLEKQQ